MKSFLEKIKTIGLEAYSDKFTSLLEKKEQEIFHDNVMGQGYNDIIKSLPDIKSSVLKIDTDRIRIGKSTDLSPDQQNKIIKALHNLMPWRKGPFDIFGINLDSEWDSSIKWKRVINNIYPLENKKVLDIGSSCGYYMFKMADQHPFTVIGIEPYLTFYFQYLFLQKYLNISNVYCLPLKLEEFPATRGYFHTVFCMGILYHRRSPIDTLVQIHNTMRKKGELVLETLVIKGDFETALFPKKRYAKMNNIFFLPTIKCLTYWLERAGFDNIRCVDFSKTTLKEQRKTKWIETESLEDFLDPDNPDKTVEGYPAPIRAIMIARVR